MTTLPEYYECGICGHWHPATWDGDCRDDADRLTVEDIEDRHGTGWQEAPMPGTEDGLSTKQTWVVV